jgi:malate dehydrogenase
LELSLSDEERAALQASARSVRQNIDRAQEILMASTGA